MSKKYDASSIKFFEGLTGIQARPSMYIGDLQESIFHLLFEIVSNSIDECINGYCNQIDIKVINYKDRVEYEVLDNGRGIPIDIHQDTGKPAIELILTTIHSGGKFDNESYSCSGGLHGVGAAALNALSDFMEVEVYRSNQQYSIRFEHGIMVKPLYVIGASSKQGTLVRFSPNLNILVGAIHPDEKKISEKLRELSFLNRGLTITLDYNGNKSTFLSNDGIKEYLLNEINVSFIVEPLYVKTKQVEATFTWFDSSEEITYVFTNQIRQPLGGYHLTGFKTGISRVLLNYIRKNIKTKIEITSEDIKCGFAGILLFFCSNPQFSSQTKERLVLEAARKIVDDAISSFFFKWLEENPQQAAIIAKKVISEAERRIAQNSIKTTIKQKSTSLPIKLKDCRYAGDRDYEKRLMCEIIIVEGDSAGGSSKGGRDPDYQAILPIRGKILNTLRASSLKQILAQEDINNLIQSLGIPIFAESDIINQSLRYGKIIIMTDADVDGSHIRALLLALFIKLYPELIRNEKIYIARAPLYKVTCNRKSIYIKDEAELEQYFLNRVNNLFKITINNTIFDSIKTNQLYNQLVLFNNVLNKIEIPEISNNILSLCLIYKIFDTLDYNNIIQSVQLNKWGTLIIIEENDAIKFKLQSMYGCLNYVLTRDNYLLAMKDLSNIDFDILKQCININGIDFYNVISSLNYINTHLNKDVSLQRYKGLGEMDADQLWDTTLNPEKRAIWLVQFDDNEDIVLKYTNELMGDTINNRRDYILSNIEEYRSILSEIH